MNAIVTRSGPAMVLRPQNFAELRDFAGVAARSKMVPVAYQNKPEDVMLAVQMGSELGLAPMQALQNISVVNGRPAVWGDAMPGLCRQSAVCDDIEEWFEGEGDALTAHCKATRVGKKPVVQQFSVADAKKAGLFSKPGPWQQYPRRMLQMRARGFALRDAFPDVLRGLISVEEARDIPPDTFAGPTLDARPEPMMTTGQVINDEIPDHVLNAPPTIDSAKTAKDFLDALEHALTGCMTWTEAQTVMSHPRVVAAPEKLTGPALDRYQRIADGVLVRLGTVAADADAETEVESV